MRNLNRLTWAAGRDPKNAHCFFSDCNRPATYLVLGTSRERAVCSEHAEMAKRNGYPVRPIGKEHKDDA